AEILTALNGLIAILILLWLANIVVISGAALDAEFLRARQIASGLEAWDHIVLDPHASHALAFLAADAAASQRLSRLVAGSARSGTALRPQRRPRIVDARNPLAVSPPTRHRLTSSPLAPGDPSGPPTRGEPPA